MESQKQSYHKENLDQKLAEAAFQIVSSEGIDALSLRSLGQVVGVSRSAVYHHYKGKDELLAAVAVQGFDRLDRRLLSLVRNQPQDSSPMLEEALVEYVTFVRENRPVYELMFGYKLWNSDAQEIVASRAWFSFLQLKNFVAQLQFLGTRPDTNAHRLTQVTWAFVHGLGSLAGDNILQDSDEIALIAREATAIFLATS